MVKTTALITGILLIPWMVFSQELPRPEGVRVLIVPGRHAVLASEIAARINTISVDIGDPFKSGQPLVVFDISRYKAQAAKATAELTAAQKSWDILTKLSHLGSGSELEAVTARARLESARAQFELEQIQVNLGIIHAPFDGYLVHRIANPHEYVTPGQPLIEIIDQPLKLQLHVPSTWLAWLKPGIEFQVRLDETEKDYPARITRLGRQIDPVSQTIEVWAKITGKHPELVAGMSGAGRFPSPGGSTP